METPSNDSSRQLLDSSSSSADTTRATLVNEIKEVETPVRKKKFTVTKHVVESSGESLAESQRAKSTTASTSTTLTPLLNNVDINNNANATSVVGSTSSEKNLVNTNDSDLIRENDDVFDENQHIMHDFDNTNTNNRYTEGQDTITSLKNSIFVKQLAEIKRKSSLKNQNSVKLNSSNKTIDSLTGGTDQPSTPKNTLTNLFFKSQDSITSKRFSVHNSSKDKDQMKPLLSTSNANDLGCSYVDLNTSITTVNKQKQAAHRKSIQRLKSSSESNSAINHPEQLIDTITEAIRNNKDDVQYSQNLLDQVKLILEQNRELERRKRRYLQRIIKLIACFCLIFLFLMSLIVVASVFLQIDKIYRAQYEQRNFTNHSANHHHLSAFISNSIDANSTLIKIVDLFSPNTGRNRN